MREKILHNCFLLHVHKEMTGSINMTDVATEFVSFQATSVRSI